MNGVGLSVLALSYLLGAVPFGLLLGRWRGIDPRSAGSGNIGATNLIRTGGRFVGVATFFLDAAKGAAAPLLARAVGLDETWVAGAALAAVVGHCFPVYLAFRGGKGVATLFGAFVVLSPVSALISAGIFAASLLLWRYVAVSSMLLALTLAAVCLWRGGPLDPHTLCAAAGSLLVAYKHRGNWDRIRRGTEGRAFASDPGEAVDG
jgi:glycerol-3-phosphate acyltransferase PlsY